MIAEPARACWASLGDSPPWTAFADGQLLRVCTNKVVMCGTVNVEEVVFFYSLFLPKDQVELEFCDMIRVRMKELHRYTPCALSTQFN